MYLRVNTGEPLKQLNLTYHDQLNVSIPFHCSNTVKKHSIEHHPGMELVAVQLLGIVGMFGSMLAAFMVPYLCVARWPATLRGIRYQLALSLANCFSGGVFLATFFVGLLPEVREMFEAILEVKGIHTSIPVTECMVFVGFSLALLIEQVALDYQEKKSAVLSTNSSSSINIDKNDFQTNSGPRRSKNNLKCQSREPLLPGASQSTEEEDTDSKTTKTISNHVSKSDTDQTSSDDDYTDKLESSPLATSGHSHTSGHGHSHADVSSLVREESGVRFLLLVLSLSVHSIFEGLALGLQSNVGTLINLLLGVAVHEWLVAFSMGVNIARLSLSRGATLRFAALFSATIPVGQLVGLLVGSNQTIGGQTASAVLQAISAGTFIHVTFLEVIPSELKDGGHRLLKVFFLFIGFLLLLICSILLNEGAGHIH
ncbi:zinc transporter ZIP3-like [Limulus polyphemus]|uniref:Zinc transporter ZIP3 n=1 Tax=Limulus polyphemus TaxID=6850 RepID=A0ABM1TFE8_LIMPO|nr:zinc transporter ZIP3-like [Limulus polyphemus]